MPARNFVSKGRDTALSFSRAEEERHHLYSLVGEMFGYFDTERLK